MQKARIAVIAVALSALSISGCATTEAALTGVGGIFQGAGEDVRRLGRY